jgi:O-antigen/teichoic acid export membrane protein
LASIKKNLVFNFLLSGSQLFVPLFTIPYLAHVLEPSGIGKVSFVDSFTFYFIAIAEFGIVVYGMREVARVRANKEELNSLVSELVTLHIVSSAFTIIAYSIAISFLWNRIHDWRLILFSFSFLLTNSLACEWYYYGTEQFRYIASRSIFTRLCGLASIFILIHEPKDYYIYYAVIAGSGILNIILNFGRLLGELKLSLFKGDWKKHIRKTWITYSISLLYSISLMLDNVLLGLVSTAAFVGFYAFAIKLVRLSSTALTDTLLVFFPHAVNLLHLGEKEKFQKTILRNIQLMNLFSIPLGVGMYLLSDDIAAVVFGPAFAKVAVDIRILSAVPFLRCNNLFLSKQVLIAYNNEKLYVKSLIISGAIFICSTLVLSTLFNDVGASISMVIYEFSLLALNYYYSRKTDSILNIFDATSVLHALIGSLLFIPLVFLFRRWMQPDAVYLIVTIAACGILYVLFQLFVLRNEFMLTLRTWSLNYLGIAFQKRNKE